MRLEDLAEVDLRQPDVAVLVALRVRRLGEVPRIDASETPSAITATPSSRPRLWRLMMAATSVSTMVFSRWDAP
jgi:hypothetical protein